LIPPVWSGLPRGQSGVVVHIYNETDTYDVFLDSGVKVSNVPINFMRPDNILCRGKKVKRSTAD
jgi:hypothetical protein